jgi:GlpG protein
MRLIGHLATESSARTFGDYLYSQEIDNHVEFEKEGGWAVWITDEDKIPQASSILKDFDLDPQNAKYRAGAKQAAQRRADEARKKEEYLKRVRDVSSISRPLAEYGFGPVVLVLMLISTVVFVLTRFGTEPQVVSVLFISGYFDSGLTEIRHGQVWRLITPMFIHFNALHIIFNLLWLRDLGGMVEIRHGWWGLLRMVLVLSAVSNLVQYFLGGPVFGGMSGVVYGLLGYVWLRGKFDPASGFFLHSITVAMMIGWFVLGFSGILGPIANWAHAGGLVTGMAWGYLASQRGA